jgi:hypothetical protein
MLRDHLSRAFDARPALQRLADAGVVATGNAEVCLWLWLVGGKWVSGRGECFGCACEWLSDVDLYLLQGGVTGRFVYIIMASF